MAWQGQGYGYGPPPGGAPPPYVPNSGMPYPPPGPPFHAGQGCIPPPKHTGQEGSEFGPLPLLNPVSH